MKTDRYNRNAPNPRMRNQIINGDCVHVLKSLPDASIDLAVTDPPYLVGYKDRNGRKIRNDDSPDNVMACFPEIFRVLKADSFSVCFYGWNRVDLFLTAWKAAGFAPVGHMVWQKNYSSRVGYLKATHEQAYLLAKGRPARPARPLTDIQPWEYTGNRRHPTEKAVSVFRPLIESFSKPGDVVLDPFSGSGSTAVAAAFTGRDYLGIEIEPDYCNLARKRLSGVARFLNPSVAA